MTKYFAFEMLESGKGYEPLDSIGIRKHLDNSMKLKHDNISIKSWRWHRLSRLKRRKVG